MSTVLDSSKTKYLSSSESSLATDFYVIDFCRLNLFCPAAFDGDVNTVVKPKFLVPVLDKV
jgi:hypothetical protein